MKRILLTLAFVACAVPTTARSQEEKPSAESGEDLEIMRYILKKRLTPLAMNAKSCLTCHASGSVTSGTLFGLIGQDQPVLGQLAFSPQGALLGHPHGLAGADGLSLEGVRLAGYGVVFTITVPEQVGDPHPRDVGSSSKGPTDWERARQELQGKKPTPPSPQKAPQQTIGDVVLKTLAENGQHLQGLDDDDKVTMVVIFRDQPRASKATTMLHVPGTSSRPPAYVPRTTLTQPSSFEQNTESKEQLGDLHMRNKKYQDATRAYQALLEDKQLAAKDHERILAKLAQAYISLGEYQRGAALLAKLAEPAKEETKPKSTAPPRLTVTATKKQLDQVGKKEMSLAEFRKAVTIE